MAALRISKFIRIDPAALREDRNDDGRALVSGPTDFVHSLKPGIGIVEASWDDSRQLGCATRYGVVVSVNVGGAEVRWSQTDAAYRPSPAGRRWWKQSKPFFCFAPDVAERYLLAAAFSEHFPEGVALEQNNGAPHVRLPRPSTTPTGGYVYLVRSQHGIKIGKSVNVKSRTRLFEVKLPFPISVEHYAWFEDYSFAERQLHTMYHAKRLEGEWFNLSDQDVAHIKTLGKSVPVDGL